MNTTKDERTMHSGKRFLALPRYFQILLLVLLIALPAALVSSLPANARFLSPDTYDPWLQGVDINRYAYGGNDPINNSDPNGHENLFGVSPEMVRDYNVKAAAKEISPYADTDFNADVDDVHQSMGMAFGGASAAGVTALGAEAVPAAAALTGLRLISRSVFGPRGRAEAVNQLTPGQAANLQRMMGRTAKSLRSEVNITHLKDGYVKFEVTVPGRVPG